MMLPLNSIWEGAGNIMALDLLRALRPRAGQAEGVQAIQAELTAARGAHPVLDRFGADLLTHCAAAADLGNEAGARLLARDVALALQASLLCRHAPDFVADAFCRSRLDGAGTAVFGTLPRGLDTTRIVERALPR